MSDGVKIALDKPEKLRSIFHEETTVETGDTH